MQWRRLADAHTHIQAHIFRAARLALSIQRTGCNRARYIHAKFENNYCACVYVCVCIRLGWVYVSLVLFSDNCSENCNRKLNSNGKHRRACMKLEMIFWYFSNSGSAKLGASVVGVMTHKYDESVNFLLFQRLFIWHRLARSSNNLIGFIGFLVEILLLVLCPRGFGHWSRLALPSGLYFEFCFILPKFFWMLLSVID